MSIPGPMHVPLEVEALGQGLANLDCSEMPRRALCLLKFQNICVYGESEKD